MESMAVINVDDFGGKREKAPTKTDLLKLYNVQQSAEAYIDQTQKSLKPTIIDQKLIAIRGSVLLAEGRLGSDKRVRDGLAGSPLWKKLLGLFGK
jgi:hypothetical protein